MLGDLEDFSVLGVDQPLLMLGIDQMWLPYVRLRSLLISVVSYSKRRVECELIEHRRRFRCVVNLERREKCVSDIQ